MSSFDLFPQDQVVGIFRGVREGGLEFYADLVLPYRNNFPDIPLQGQFLLVQLETANEAVLGRITSFYSDGKLSIEESKEFHFIARREERNVLEDLLENYLKLRIT